MTTFLQIIILFALASVAILIIYLIDRVNNLQRYTRLLQPDKSADDGSSGPFGDLAGQKLWDAVSGVPIEGWDQTSIELVRNRYQLVLKKHVEETFSEGLHNAQSGIQSIPLPSRIIQTLRGPVESWIPVESAIAIYKAGSDRARAQESDLPKVRKGLDDAVLAVFAAAGIQLSRPVSEHLIPLTDNERAAQTAVATAHAAGHPANTQTAENRSAASALPAPQTSQAPALAMSQTASAQGGGDAGLGTESLPMEPTGSRDGERAPARP
jgi:hypothetical protein